MINNFFYWYINVLEVKKILKKNLFFCKSLYLLIILLEKGYLLQQDIAI